MADVTFKVKHGDTEVSVTVAGAELSGSITPAGMELRAEKCGELSHVAVTATGVGKVWDSEIQSNGSIATDQKAAAGGKAAEQAANDALSEQVSKLTSGFKVRCPDTCKDFVVMMAIPAGQRNTTPGQSDDGGILGYTFWTSTATQAYNIYYGCAKDLQVQATMIAAIVEEARRIAQTPSSPATRTEMSDAAKSGFYMVPGARPSDTPVYLFQPKHLDDLMVEKIKTLKVPSAVVETSTGAFENVANVPLADIASNTGDPGEGENDRIRRLVSTNSAIRDFVGGVLGKRLPIKFVSRTGGGAAAATERAAIGTVGRPFSTDGGGSDVDTALAEAMRRLLLRGLGAAGGGAPAPSASSSSGSAVSPLSAHADSDDDIDMG